MNSIEQKDKEYTEKEKKQLLYQYHDALTGEHQGVECTLNRLKTEHRWKGITKNVENYIAECEKCQKNKLSKKQKALLIITDISEKP